ncbi:MAG TPA: TolC family protein [Gemmatales bacterium]|nr:TolC family protein [Gemmatales bacterium]
MLPWRTFQLSDPLNSGERAARLIPGDHQPSCSHVDVSQRLSIGNVVVASLCHNPDTRAAYLRLVAEGARYASNYSGYLPTVTATTSRSRATSFGENTKNSAVSSNYGLALGLTLYDFGQREFRLETAEFALLAAGHGYNATIQGTIAAALQAYYSLLRAQSAVEVAADAERFARESYEAAQLRHQIGQVPLADVLQAKGGHSQAILRSQAATNGLALQQASLAQLMGFSADTPVVVTEVDDGSLALDPFEDQLSELMRMARSKRQDLLATQASLKASEQSLKALRRSNLATISATASSFAANDSIDLFGPGGSRNNAIGVSVSIPIFTGFVQTYNERAAEKELQAQKEALTRRELSVEQDVWNAWHNYETAKQQWVTSEDQMVSAVQLKDVALGRYKEGLGSILDVLNAQLQYSTALQIQLESRYNLFATRVDLIRAVGVLTLNTLQHDVMVTLIPPQHTATRR